MENTALTRTQLGDQLNSLISLGYIEHGWSIATAGLGAVLLRPVGGTDMTLTLSEAQLYVSGMLAGAQGREKLRSIWQRRQAAIESWPTPEKTIDQEALRLWTIHGDYSRTIDPWYTLIVAWNKANDN